MVCACLHAACFNPTVLLHTGRQPGKQQTFCTLREPIDHLLSEFNFRAKPEGCNEPFLNNWVKTKLEKELMASRHRDDCHLLSSADYAHTCDYKVPYDHKHAGLALLLRVRFGIEFDMSTRLGGLTHQVHPMWDLRCHAKPHNLTTESIEMIRDHYAEDFEIYHEAQRDWGPLIEEGACIVITAMLHACVYTLRARTHQAHARLIWW